MKKLNIEIELYEYDELDEKAKEKAFCEHEHFLIENPSTYEDEDENGNIIMKYENIDEWTYQDIKEYVEDSIRINEYLFFKDGSLADITHYTGKHDKVGLTELKLCGNIYIV